MLTNTIQCDTALYYTAKKPYMHAYNVKSTGYNIVLYMKINVKHYNYISVIIMTTSTVQ